MLFNSFAFVYFLPIVFILYWFVVNKSLRLQNFFLMVASYFFYGWWDWRFLFLIFFSSIVDFTLGLKMGETKNPKTRKALLITSLVVNLGILGFFKYYNFFVDSFIYAFSTLGITLHATTLQVILPVGISFYTFQTLSYTLDIYKNKLEPTRDPIAFFAFVSFFPQLVAGPIERAKALLPQFYVARKFDLGEAKDGMRQMLWGLFKKVVVADNCAGQVDTIFSNYESMPASMLVLGAIFFAFQIYCDFSGYSDIAIGVARLFGFKLMRNFAYPYFSRNITEFWRRWHISLSTWFRDYVYIPLGGSRAGKSAQVRNLLITFTVSGFWHGANWTFIFWGFINGLYMVPGILKKERKKYTAIVAENSALPTAREFLLILGTFVLSTITWIFFRSDTITDAFRYIGGMFSKSLLTMPRLNVLVYLFPIAFMLIVEWIQRRKQHALQFSDDELNVYIRWTIYIILSLAVVAFFSGNKSFIYFQF